MANDVSFCDNQHIKIGWVSSDSLNCPLCAAMQQMRMLFAQDEPAVAYPQGKSLADLKRERQMAGQPFLGHPPPPPDPIPPAAPVPMPFDSQALQAWMDGMNSQMQSLTQQVERVLALPTAVPE